jgi:hypothetical protein
LNVFLIIVNQTFSSFIDSYEAQEPLISGSVLTGEAAVPSRTLNKKSSAKVRSKTAEEIMMQEAAERTVQQALERQMALPESERRKPSEKAPLSPGPGLGNMENTPELDLIDQVLAGQSLLKMKPAEMTSFTEVIKETYKDKLKAANLLKELDEPTPSVPVPTRPPAPAPAAKVSPPPPPGKVEGYC